MRIVVTGGAGFIGSRIAQRLHEDGNNVHVIDQLGRVRQHNLDLLKMAGVDVLKQDVTSHDIRDSIKRIAPEVVVHAAALISVRESEERPLLYERVNSEGTLNVLLASSDLGVRQFVYISSAAVFGNPKYLPIDESHPKNPISVYGVSKLNGEIYAEYFRAHRSMSIFIPRVFNAYGIGQNAEYAGVIAIFKKAIEDHKNPVIYGDGRQTRDFVHVSDIANIVARGIAARINDTVNIGTGRQTSVNELAEKMIEITGADLHIEHAPQLPAEIMHSYADIRKMHELGLETKVSLEQGLKEFTGW